MVHRLQASRHGPTHGLSLSYELQLQYLGSEFHNLALG